MVDEAWKYSPLDKVLTDLTSDLTDAFVKYQWNDHVSKITQDGDILNIMCDRSCDDILSLTTIIDSNTNVNPVINIHVKANISVVLMQNHTGVNTFHKNQHVKIVLEEGAQLSHAIIESENANAVIQNNIHANLAQNAVYEPFIIHRGAKLIRSAMSIQMDGMNAVANIGGVQVISGDNHSDITALINHNVGQTHSMQFIRNIIDDRARGAFKGKIYVAEQARQSDARQICKSILLSERAEMNTKPELEIYNDDVQCAHGATTGALDSEALFYMQSRGIPYDKARQLLQDAFIDEAYQIISSLTLREAVQNA